MSLDAARLLRPPSTTMTAAACAKRPFVSSNAMITGNRFTLFPCIHRKVELSPNRLDWIQRTRAV